MTNAEHKPEHDPGNWSAELKQQIQEIREDLTKQHAEILRWGLVVWTGGNVSSRVPGYDLMGIKPSGLSYDDLTPESMVVCDLYGNVVPGEHAPSSHPDSHASRDRHRGGGGGVG